MAARAEMVIDHHLPVFSFHFTKPASPSGAEMAIDHHLPVFSFHFTKPEDIG